MRELEFTLQVNTLLYDDKDPIFGLFMPEYVNNRKEFIGKDIVAVYHSDIRGLTTCTGNYLLLEGDRSIIHESECDEAPFIYCSRLFPITFERNIWVIYHESEISLALKPELESANVLYNWLKHE